MQIQQKFVNKYKSQFYPQTTSIKSLIAQQKQLTKLLQDLHTKTQQYFDHACKIASKRKESMRNSSNKKQNLSQIKLPHIVVDAELKNSHTYRLLLEKQRFKLERRMEIVEGCLRNKNIDGVIREQRGKLVELGRNNRNQEWEIRKLGDKIIEGAKTPKQIYEQLLLQTKTKKQQNSQKRNKLAQITQRSSELQQKTVQLEQQLQNSTPIAQETPNETMQYLKLSHLQKSKQKLQQNIESLKTRLRQQYYNKLKQLEIIVKKKQEVDKQIQKCMQKIEEKSQQLQQSRVFA